MLKLDEIVAQMGTTTSPSFNKIGSKTKKFYYRTVFVRVSFFYSPLICTTALDVKCTKKIVMLGNYTHTHFPTNLTLMASIIIIYLIKNRDKARYVLIVYKKPASIYLIK